MKAKHTPGPWAITRRWADGKRIIVEGNQEDWFRLEAHVVCDDCDTDTAEANARLIAAAPDLLEACKAMLRTHGVHGPCTHHNCDSCEMAYDKAKAAIAKAEN